MLIEALLEVLLVAGEPEAQAGPSAGCRPLCSASSCWSCSGILVAEGVVGAGLEEVAAGARSVPRAAGHVARADVVGVDVDGRSVSGDPFTTGRITCATGPSGP